MSVNQPFLSVVIPAYNEEGRIIPTLTKVTAYLGQQGYSWKVLVVDDGSVDNTAQLVKEYATESHRVSLIQLSHRGKGHAVKMGMLAINGQHRFLCDADLSMPIQELERFLSPSLEGYDVAIGSREALGAHRYNEPLYRHLMGRVFNLIVQMIAVPGIHDTQCGFKCFTEEAAERLFPLQRVEGFGFDVEILFLAKRFNMRIAEVPIEWYHEGRSKISPMRDTFKMFREALSVRWNAWRGYYG